MLSQRASGPATHPGPLLDDRAQPDGDPAAPGDPGPHLGPVPARGRAQPVPQLCRLRQEAVSALRPGMLPAHRAVQAPRLHI